jgi:hypothetical protein
MRVLLLWLAAILLADSALAQPPLPLFVHAEADAQVTADAAPRPSNTPSRVNVRLDVLFSGPGGVAQRVLVNAGAHTWTARFERHDVDAAGFQSWVGHLEEVADSHVVITARAGVISGLINAVGITYQLLTERPGAYLLERVDLEALGDEREPHDATPLATVPGRHDLSTAADDARTFDVLILYTPAARNARGGTAQIEALVSQVISDTNTAMARSAALPRVRLVGSHELGFAEAPEMAADLPALRASPDARLLRDAYRADLVQLLVASPDTQSCGVAYLLSVYATDFDAYSIADVTCAAQYTPTHEMAHNMGSHHAPEDGASAALFPFSYAYKDPEHGFRTVMAYPCAQTSCQRVLNFSNPRVAHDGFTTGTPQQDNARSINEAASTVASFRSAAPAPSLPQPAAPSGLAAAVAGNLVTLQWHAVPESSGQMPQYVLQVGTRPGAVNIYNAAVGAVTTLSGVVPAGQYFWRVIAVVEGGTSPPSNEAQFLVGGCSPPSPPTNLLYSVTGRMVTLMWSPASGAGSVTYVLEAGSASGLSDLLVSLVGSGLSLVTDAPPGRYYVRLRARNACGISVPSNEQVIAVP